MWIHDVDSCVVWVVKFVTILKQIILSKNIKITLGTYTLYELLNIAFIKSIFYFQHW